MQTGYMQAMLAGTWMLLIGVLGYLAGITSLVGWAALLAVALAPPVIVRRVWGARAPTMSETIQDVLR
jgi:hypothetical protein